MKFILAILLLLSPVNDLNKIKKANEHKEAAKEAYLAGDYEKAVYHYRYLKDSLQIKDENVLLNLANSLYKTQDSVASRNIYNSLLEESTPKITSQAHQQLGLMDFANKEYRQALDHFKNSLRADPGNEDARYNYELLKKIIEEQEEQQQEQSQQDQQNQEQEQQNQQQQQNQQNQDQQNQEQEQQQSDQEQQQENQENQENQQQEQEGQEQEQQEQQDQNSEEQQEQQQAEGEESEQEPEQIEPSTAEKLEEMNISEEKAKMILEAMKNNEIQYLQQNKRKAKEKKKSGKPDW